MKRSIAVSLAILGTGIALSSCGEDPAVDAAAYSSPDQCIAAGKFSREDCLSDYQTAVQDFQKTAPKFNSQKECEDEFGANGCQASTVVVQQGGGNSFVPYMMGYMMGNHRSSSPVVVTPQALYRPNSASGFVNGGGTPVTKSLGSFTLRKSSSALSSSTSGYRSTSSYASSSKSSSSVSRGIFGSRSSFGGRASFGG